MNGLSKRQGLRTKIIAWSFFPTLIILATVALVTYAAYQNVTDDLVLAKDQELTRLSASQLSTEMRAYTDLLTEIANTTDLRQVDPELQRAALERFSNRLVVFLWPHCPIARKTSVKTGLTANISARSCMRQGLYFRISC